METDLRLDYVVPRFRDLVNESMNAEGVPSDSIEFFKLCDATQSLIQQMISIFSGFLRISSNPAWFQC